MERSCVESMMVLLKVCTTVLLKLDASFAETNNDMHAQVSNPRLSMGGSLAVCHQPSL
jgi:hypothetical protein